MDKVIALDFVKIDQLSELIYKIVYRDDCKITLSDAIKVNEQLEATIKSEKIVTLTVINDRKIDLENDAQKYFANDASMAKKIMANAIIFDSLSTRILVRFYIKLHKPIHPTKIFSNEADGIEWLNSFKLN